MTSTDLRFDLLPITKHTCIDTESYKCTAHTCMFLCFGNEVLRKIKTMNAKYERGIWYYYSTIWQIQLYYHKKDNNVPSLVSTYKISLKIYPIFIWLLFKRQKIKQKRDSCVSKEGRRRTFGNRPA